MPWDLLNQYKGHSRTPLRIFCVFQGFDGLDLSPSVIQFFQQSYPIGSNRAVDPLNHLWNQEYEAVGAHLRSVFPEMKSEPMLYLFIRQQGQETSFQVGYWGCSVPNPKNSPHENPPSLYDPYLLTEQQGKEILQYCVQKLQTQGANSDELQKLAYRECGRVMSRCMALMGAFFTDAHYLIYDTLPPQLPQLLPQLLEGIEQIPTVQRLVGQVMEAYGEVLTAMKGDRAALVPDLALDMAEALVSVNRGYAQAKLNYALSSWLKLRTNRTSESSSLLRLVGEAMAENDRAFLQRLQQLYSKLRDSSALAEIKRIDGIITESDRGIDYSRLRTLLKEASWKDANRETIKLMQQASGTINPLTVMDIEKFPCKDLCTINNLWVSHSKSKFGFSVQKKIWQECGSPQKDSSNWEKFYKTLGWNVLYSMHEEDLDFSSESPIGHLPCLWCSDKLLLSGSLGLSFGSAIVSVLSAFVHAANVAAANVAADVRAKSINNPYSTRVIPVEKVKAITPNSKDKMESLLFRVKTCISPKLRS